MIPLLIYYMIIKNMYYTKKDSIMMIQQIERGFCRPPTYYTFENRKD